MTQASWDDADVALAVNIFGLSEYQAIVERLERWLADCGLPGPRVLSIELSVGAAVEVALANQSRIFAKIWPPSVDATKLGAQLRIQDELARRGFPAPRLRSSLARIGESYGVLMDFARGGEPTDVRKPGVTEGMAGGLAALIKAATSLPAARHLPRHELAELWPTPHNVLFDFEATAVGAEWIDQIARDALAILRADRGAAVAGHLDWSAKNMRMAGSGLSVVYDWDALHLADECFVVGSAAASFPTTWELPVDGIATSEQVAQFLGAYQRARDADFSEAELSRIQASVVYSRSYRARCEHALDAQAAKERWSIILSR